MKSETIKYYYREWEGIPIQIKWEPQPFGSFESELGPDYDFGCLAILAWQSKNLWKGLFSEDWKEHKERERVRNPLPISETGYRHFWPNPHQVNNMGGPVVYALALLDEAGQDPKWKKIKTSTRQKELF